jgi:uncharacterized membrane protein YqaE (UPF0057 family)
MIYLLCVLFPPLAVLLVGKPFQAFINLLLCFLLWIPAIIHSIAIVNDKKQNKRMKKQTKQILKLQQK